VLNNIKVNPKCTDKHEDLNIASLYLRKIGMVWMIAKIDMERKRLPFVHEI
jgi:hypothetical protein